MSSYFVNSLATCYGGADGHGGESARDAHYPQSASPYRGHHYQQGYQGYHTAQSPGLHSQNGDYYHGMTQRLSHPPLRETASPEYKPTPDYKSPSSRDVQVPVAPSSGAQNQVPPGPQSPQARYSGTTYSTPTNNNTSTATKNGDLSPIDSSPRPTQTSAASPGSAPNSPDSPGSTGAGATPSATSSSPNSPGKSPGATQIYPWMRRMHVGHGTGK